MHQKKEHALESRENQCEDAGKSKEEGNRSTAHMELESGKT
jgi:hypothetical protein